VKAGLLQLLTHRAPDGIFDPTALDVLAQCFVDERLVVSAAGPMNLLAEMIEDPRCPAGL
jgi:hypothetical protein